MPGAGGPLIPLFALAVGNKFNCLEDDKSNNQFSSTPSLIKTCLEVPRPSASNNLEPKPLLRKGSSIARKTSFLKDSLNDKIANESVTLIDDPLIADAK